MLALHFLEAAISDAVDSLFHSILDTEQIGDGKITYVQLTDDHALSCQQTRPKF